MVAAWISAETGVGPSMASGSQTYSGNCADFPVAPMNSSSAMVLKHAESRGLRVKLAAAQDLVHVHKLHCAQHAEHQQHAENESRVAHAVDDERFFPGVARRFLLEIKADQQITAQAHAFPADEH